jgi:Arc/MetJ-type ribon-helix-helix transcriptional regulator
MSNMTTVRLPDDIAAAMLKLQDRDGIPASEQIRRALRAWLAAKRVYTPKKVKK